MFIDPSGRGADETGWAVTKHLMGNIFLMDAGGSKAGYSPEALETLAMKAKEHQVKVIQIESNFGDGMFAQLLRPILARVYPCTIEEIRSTSQKEARIIETLEPVMASHRLVVDPRVIEEDYKTSADEPKFGLFYQLTRLTKERGSLAKDDRLDAVALAVAYWTEAMSRDQNKAVENLKDQQVHDSLKDFMRKALGKGIFRDRNGSGFLSGNRASRR